MNIILPPEAQAEPAPRSNSDRRVEYFNAVRREIELGLADLVQRMGAFEMTCLGGLPGSVPDVLHWIGVMYECPSALNNNHLSNAAGRLSRRDASERSANDR